MKRLIEHSNHCNYVYFLRKNEYYGPQQTECIKETALYVCILYIKHLLKLKLDAAVAFAYHTFLVDRRQTEIG